MVEDKVIWGAQWSVVGGLKVLVEFVSPILLALLLHLTNAGQLQRDL